MNDPDDLKKFIKKFNDEGLVCKNHVIKKMGINEVLAKAFLNLLIQSGMIEFHSKDIREVKYYSFTKAGLALKKED